MGCRRKRGTSGVWCRDSTRAATRSFLWARPNDIEKKHHYLWRFWQNIPKGGHITIFDRSWYGRVLVERIEGFCRVDEWKRAYGEIREFEKQLADFGMVIVKFWLHIDPDEQLRRFKLRADHTVQIMEDHRRGLAQQAKVERV